MFHVFQPQRKILPTVPPQSALSLHPTTLNLGHPCLTRRPQVVSETGPRETNETQNSYGLLRRSYEPCLTQRPNRIWRRHSAETPMKHLISTIPPDPLRHATGSPGPRSGNPSGSPLPVLSARPQCGQVAKLTQIRRCDKCDEISYESGQNSKCLMLPLGELKLTPSCDTANPVPIVCA